MAYNRIVLMGRIVNDIELRTTPTGVTVASFRIAVDANYQTKGEERKSYFFNIVAWRSTGEFIHRYFSKGRMILVEGELTNRNYTDKNGNTNTWYEIVADKAFFTGEPKQSGAYGDSYGGGYNAPAPSPAPAPAGAPVQYQTPAPAAPAAPVSDFSVAESDDGYPF